VITLQKGKDEQIVSVSIRGKSIEDLLTKEWLLTNQRGSYASSTVVGCNTRGYHGLLIGTLSPPANRIMALANFLEMVICDKKVFNLSTFEFSDIFEPAGFSYIKQFRQDIGVHFDYELDTRCWMLDARGEKRVSSIENRASRIELTKSVYLLRDSDTVTLVYGFTNVEEPIEFILRPFVGLRDFHTLQKSYAPLCVSSLGDVLLVRHDIPSSCELMLTCPSMKFENDQQWWFNFVYRNDRERGQNFTEDLWTPGFFKCQIEEPIEIVFWANFSPCVPSASLGTGTRDASCEKINTQYAIRNTQYDINAIKEDLRRHQDSVITIAKAKDESFRILCLAADQFIVTRDPCPVSGLSSDEPRATSDERRVTVLAGFPWFADWGRDAFIALPGLLLSTGRFDQAKSVLTTFAQAADQGMIPNCFDDRSDTAYFNSVDASLWFINAAFQYLSAADDSKTFTQEFLPVIRWIIDSYQKGTRFGIYADADGLITAGDNDTQLTWMDAKYEGVAFTPRCGKAVEVNALWYNALCLIAQFYVRRNEENVKHYKSMAEKVGASFCQLFWNESLGYLNDCIRPDGSADTSLRPNQIFAVSLTFSPPLSLQQQKSIVDIVQKELLTPYGLRTLNVQHSDYKGTYIGPQQARDHAYHQGTVWPYLIGPFVEAYLKVNEFSRKSKKRAAEFIEPLMRHLTEDGCLGQIGEIFDGDAPHRSRGCIAQAWSVAELLRAYQLIND